MLSLQLCLSKLMNIANDLSSSTRYWTYVHSSLLRDSFWKVVFLFSWVEI